LFGVIARVVWDDGLVGAAGGVGLERDDSVNPISAPRIWAAMKPGADAAAIPANVSEIMRPMVSSGNDPP
jgi:hypothetical protein